MELGNMVEMQNQFCADCIADICHMDRQECIESEDARPYFMFFRHSVNRLKKSRDSNSGGKVYYCLEEKITAVIKKAPPALTGEAI